MAYPKKGRGKQALRRIVVNGHLFRWRFRAKSDALTVCGAMPSGRPLHIIVRGWRDPWLNIADFVRDDSNALMLSTIITPRFVREAILQGLASGWHPYESGAKLICIYEGGNWSNLSPRH